MTDIESMRVVLEDLDEFGFSTTTVSELHCMLDELDTLRDASAIAVTRLESLVEHVSELAQELLESDQENQMLRAHLQSLTARKVVQ